MGIPCLTSLIENNKKEFSTNFELHDCDLVIDTGSLLKLTNTNDSNRFESLKSNVESACCYGGDFDKYHRIIKEFISVLKQCHINPYFFVHGQNTYDAKVHNFEERLEKSITISPDLVREIKTGTDKAEKKVIYNVGLSNLILDAISECGCKRFMIGNKNLPNTAAHFAKYLNCPVLGENSDFFIHGAKYIPISWINDVNPVEKATPSGSTYKFINCKIFTVNKVFKNRYNNPNLRYMLPVLIGDTNWEHFYRRIRVQGNIYQKLEKTIRWLQRQSSAEDVIENMLHDFSSKTEKNRILNVIQEIADAYSPSTVDFKELLEYFHVRKSWTTTYNKMPINFSTFDFEQLEKANDKSKYSNLRDSTYLMEKIKKCELPSYFTLMFLGDVHNPQPYIDDYCKEDCHQIAHKLISAIYAILAQNFDKGLQIIERTKINKTGDKLELIKIILPAYSKILPDLEQISNLNRFERQMQIFAILDFDQELFEQLDKIPENWHLFLLAIKYCRQHSTLDNVYVGALILNFIILNYVDPLCGDGFYRTGQDFHKFLTSTNDMDLLSAKNLNNISTSDDKEDPFDLKGSELLILMQNVIHLFEMQETDTEETFNRSIMHTLSEFHCIFLYLKDLNLLFNQPYNNAYLWKVYNGTFLYNVVKNCLEFRGSESKLFFENLFTEKPSILNVFNILCDFLKC